VEEIIVNSTGYAPYLAYIGIFLILVLCGLGLPVPEETVLIGGGYLASSGFLDHYAVLAIGFLGVLVGDFIVFTIGWRWGSGVITHQYLQRVFTPRRMVKVRKYFRTHRDRTIFMARFLSGFRIAAFLTAGMMKMRARTFLSIDTLAAMISVPLFFMLGYFLHDHLQTLLNAIGNANRILTLLALILVGTYFYFRRRKRAKE
jgi:membrane protein DedA with SNARE-associated domain